MKLPEYRVVLKEDRGLSGELIVSGGVEECLKPVVPHKKKAIIHAYMARNSERVGKVQRLVDRMKSPVPRSRIAPYRNPYVQLIPLGFFYAESDYDERKKFPQADIIFVQGVPIVTSYAPTLPIEIASSVEGLMDDVGEVRQCVMRAIGVYSLRYRGKEVQLGIPEPTGRLYSPIFWLKKLAARKISEELGRLRLEIEDAVNEGNLAAALELELKAKEIIVRHPL